ncbi:Bifunctional NAD(P)H-hydrate repair enzyme Nnr [Bienertia sinuspersici]
MGLVEAWERSHMRKDESFAGAKAKVESLNLANFSYSSVDVEDEAFHDLMNEGDIPERPQGFGFGVKKSDIYGVRGLLKKEGSKKSKQDRAFRKNDEYTKTLKAVVTQFSQIQDVMRNGKASVQLIDAAQSALHMAIPEGGGGGGKQTRICSGGGDGGGGWGNSSLKRRLIEGGNGAPIPSRTSQTPMSSTLVPPIAKHLNLSPVLMTMAFGTGCTSSHSSPLSIVGQQMSRLGRGG